MNNEGIERAALALALNNESNAVELVINLDENDFANIKNQLIFLSIKKLSQAGATIDKLSIISSFKEFDIQENFDAVEYLENISQLPELLDADDSGIHYYIEQLKVLSLRRKLSNAMDSAQKKIEGEEFSNRGDVICSIEDYVYSVINETDSGYTVSTEFGGENLLERIKKRIDNPEETYGIQTFIPTLNKYTLGFYKKNLIVIAGRSNAGKSLLIDNFAADMCIKRGIPGIIIDTEMVAEEREDRILSLLSGVAESEIRTGVFKNDTRKQESIVSAAGVINSGNLVHVGINEFNTTNISMICKKYKALNDIQVVFLDFIKEPSDSSRMQEFQKLGLLASNLKQMSKRYDIAFVAACQLNRDAYDTENIEDVHIAGSDRIFWWSDVVLAIRRATYNERQESQRSNSKLQILKNRRGESKIVISMYHDHNTCRFMEAGNV